MILFKKPMTPEALSDFCRNAARAQIKEFVLRLVKYLGGDHVAEVPLFDSHVRLSAPIQSL